MHFTQSPAPFKESRNNKSPSRIAVEQALIEHSNKGGLSIPRLAEIVGVDVTTVRRALTGLRDTGQLVNLGTQGKPAYAISSVLPKATAAPNRYVPRGSYDGAELRPYEGRPGAMTAYHLPSLRDGVRVPYNGIRPMLVGALKDSSNNAR